MAHRATAMLWVFLLLSPAALAEAPRLADYRAIEGFVDLWWDEGAGRLLMRVDALDTPMIYQVSLPRGVGSNDLGLDRGQLGATRVVRFQSSGPKVLLVEDNLRYRATTDSEAEKRAVAESFASSVIWGFEDLDPGSDTIVDATAFFVRDAHGVAGRLAATGEGSYGVDSSRSAVYLPRTKAFPDNTEVEAIVTLAGNPAGRHLPTVATEPGSITVHVHHSFVRLPDDDYAPLAYDPRAGIAGLDWGDGSFLDYGSAIGESLRRNFGRRHRLEKKDPAAALGEPVEPIVYYVDPGAPEPVRSALIEGTSWWNAAFEAAGYRNAFQVKLLPEGADPMDVRYNVVQWVHRSTRGWSYGSTVHDPRTGEILKGHVTLGSLRVRQDYLIAEGLLSPYASAEVPPEMLGMSLARIRQLAAHEVGHTLGFEHNFAASTQDRASVMDYPFPLIRIRDDGTLDLDDAYAVGIGAWDERLVLYAYQDFPDGTDEAAARRKIVSDTIMAGFRYIDDGDARSVSSAHPDGNLWDNGADAVAELEHLLAVREIALRQFSARTVRIGRPLAALEEALVPIYLLHRYQVEAAGKLIGGQYYRYALRGDGQPAPQPVPVARQQQAIDALVATLHPDVLRLPPALVAAIQPRVTGDARSRETFSGSTGVVFDPIAPARAAVALTLDVLLDRARAARLARAGTPGFAAVTSALLEATWRSDRRAGADGAIQRQTGLAVMHELLRLAFDERADTEVRAQALASVRELASWLEDQSVRDAVWRAHYEFAGFEIARLLAEPAQIDLAPRASVPPGSPIG